MFPKEFDMVQELYHVLQLLKEFQQEGAIILNISQ